MVVRGRPSRYIRERVREKYQRSPNLLPRAVRDTRLETRTARLSLPVNRHPYKRAIEQGLILLYYRGALRGSWSVRIFNTKLRKYEEYKLGLADDRRDADGVEVLDFKQAQTKAKGTVQQVALNRSGRLRPDRYTVKDAIDDYLDWFKAHRKSHRDVERRLNLHVIPHFGDQLIHELTRDEIEVWHRRLALAKAQVGMRPGQDPKNKHKRRYRESDPRARKVTANRTLAYFRAALNRAHRAGRVVCNPVWMTVEPFRGVEKARVEYFTEGEAKRLINAAAPEVKALIQAALYTGCRFSELASLKVRDFNSREGTIFVEQSKSARSRYVPLTQEGIRFFDHCTAGRLARQVIFANSKEEAWKQLDNKAFNEARAAAKANSNGTFHSLRHTYASLMLNNGASLEVICKILGHHSIAITEKHYAHMADSVKKQAVERFLPSFGFSDSNVINL